MEEGGGEGYRGILITNKLKLKAIPDEFEDVMKGEVMNGKLKVVSSNEEKAFRAGVNPMK